MKKVLFLFLTMLSFVALYVASDFAATKYILTDSYVSPFNADEAEQDEYAQNAMQLDEYFSMIENGENPMLEDPSQIPLDIQMIEMRSFVLRIFVFVIMLTLTGFAAFAIKSDRVDFAVLALDTTEKGINRVRIALYVMIFMSAFLSAQNYPITFLWGWIPTVLWAANMLALTIWVLNIIYAFKERRTKNGKALKPARL